MKLRTLVVAGILALGLPSTAIVIEDASATAPSPCGTNGTYIPQAPPAKNSCEYESTGAEDTFAVPAGVSSVEITVGAGAGGDGGDGGWRGGQGAWGALVSGEVPVDGATTLYVEVGGNGTDAGTLAGPVPGGFNGGGSSGDNGDVTGGVPGGSGGGASDVRTISRASAGTLASRLIVAAGGGGGGGGGGYDEIGGDAGEGGATGGNGSDAGISSFPCDCWGRGGTGATASAGGAGGIKPPDATENCSASPGPGTLPRAGGSGVAGDGGAGGCGDGGSGGGGGGGYFGGGAGSGSDDGHPGGGGGGGSNHVGDAVPGTISQTVNNLSVPKVIIAWTTPPPPNAACGSGTTTNATTCTYTFTGAPQSFVVPVDVTSIHVALVGGKGAQGGACPATGASAGGFGASIAADMPVVSGRLLYAIVGGNGSAQTCLSAYTSSSGGYNGGGAGADTGSFDYSRPGGGGGGASDLRTDVGSNQLSSLASRLVVAGGGGGGGGHNIAAGGAGGNAGQDGGDGTEGNNGGLGHSIGLGGEAGSYYGSSGGSNCRPGDDGQVGFGGHGGTGCFGHSNESGGGGGGGGYYGGGGGSGSWNNDGAGGGGGGSSYLAYGTTNSSEAIDTTGAPKIVISWTPDGLVGGGADAVSPVVDISVPAANELGWQNDFPGVATVTATDDVAITDLACDGAYADVAGLGTTSASATLTVYDYAGSFPVHCYAHDAAGNVGVDDDTIRIDTVKPVLTGVGYMFGSPDYTAGSWTQYAVDVTFDCVDPGTLASGVVQNNVVGASFTDSVNTTVTSTGACVDAAGNVADDAQFGPVKIDMTPPVITPNTHGYVPGTTSHAAVVVDFTCNETGTVQSGLLSWSAVYGNTIDYSTTTGSITSSGQCVDIVGNYATHVTVSPIIVDLTGGPTDTDGDGIADVDDSCPSVAAPDALGDGCIPQSISFTSTAPSDAQVDGPAYGVTATATSGLAVAFTIDAATAASCAVTDGSVTFAGSGWCTINANQPGNAPTQYGPAPQVQQTFWVSSAPEISPQTITFTSDAPTDAVVGGPSYTVGATGGASGNIVTFTIDAASSSVCTIATDVVSFAGVGTCTIKANQAGNASYEAAPQEQQSFSVGKGSQAVSFLSTPPAAVVGGESYTVTAASTADLPVTISVDASAAGVCSLDGSTVSFVGAGTCVLDADQPGDANYDPATQVQQTFTVGKGSQTVQFTSTAPSAAAVGGGTYSVTASSTSGLPVAVTVDASASSVCSITGSTVSFTGVGSCVLDADQSGNDDYHAASQVQQTFTVGKGSQTVQFTSTAPSAAAVGGSTYSVSATSSAGLTVAITVDATASSVCSITGSTVSFTGVGSCVLDADQPGDANYDPATQVQQSFTVGKGSQTVVFLSTPPANATPGGPTYTVTASSTSGLTVAITVDATATTVCSIAGSTVSFLAAGTCVLDANQPGDANYNPATQVQQSFTVGKLNQTITFGGLPARTLLQSPFTVSATASSGLAVAFTTTTPAVCSSSGSNGTKITLLAAGTCTVKADQAGNTTYNAAPSQSQSFAVTKATQTITFGALPARTMLQSPFNVSASASSGLAVTFTTTTPAVCSSSGSNGTKITLLAAGTCTVKADQAGNGTYNAAPSVSQSFTVSRVAQTITFGALSNRRLSQPAIRVSATASSGLTVTFTSTTPSVCSATGRNGATITSITVGTCTVRADQAGNATYDPAPPVSQSFTIT